MQCGNERIAEIPIVSSLSFVVQRLKLICPRHVKSLNVCWYTNLFPHKTVNCSVQCFQNKLAFCTSMTYFKSCEVQGYVPNA